MDEFRKTSDVEGFGNEEDKPTEEEICLNSDYS